MSTRDFYRRAMYIRADFLCAEIHDLYAARADSTRCIRRHAAVK